MKKVIVIGCPGSGKSTFSRELQSVIGLPLYYLDMLYWNADRTTVPKELFRERLHDVIAQDSWIIDGNYASTMELRLQACDTVFFLDYPAELCLAGIASRLGKPREDMPWIEVSEDHGFISYIKDFNTTNRPTILELLNRYSNKAIIVFRSREESAAYLEQLKEKTSSI